MVRIVEVLGFTAQGMTEPVLCRAADGNLYVVKGMNAGHTSLIAEWVACRLGRIMGLPIPNVEQLTLDDSMIRYSSKKNEVKNLGKGSLFGSLYINDAVEIRDSDVSSVGIDLQMLLLAFDFLIANADRTLIDGSAGNPNLLWRDSLKELVVIDHNNAFRPVSMDTFFSDHVFRNAGTQWDVSFKSNMSGLLRDGIAHLDEIWDEIPEDWTESGGLTPNNIRNVLTRYECYEMGFGV